MTHRHNNIFLDHFGKQNDNRYQLLFCTGMRIQRFLRAAFLRPLLTLPYIRRSAAHITAPRLMIDFYVAHQLPAHEVRESAFRRFRFLRCPPTAGTRSPGIHFGLLQCQSHWVLHHYQCMQWFLPVSIIAYLRRCVNVLRKIICKFSNGFLFFSVVEGVTFT